MIRTAFAAFLAVAAIVAPPVHRHPLTREQADNYAFEATPAISFDGTLDSFENTDVSVCCAHHLSSNRWRYPAHVHVTVPGDHRYLASIFVTWWPGERRPVVTWAWVHGHAPFSTHLPLVVAPDPEGAA